jgi:hypothetical protein
MRLMGVPTTEMGYNSATTGMGVHEVHKGHLAALKKFGVVPPKLHQILWVVKRISVK